MSSMLQMVWSNVQLHACRCSNTERYQQRDKRLVINQSTRPCLNSRQVHDQGKWTMGPKPRRCLAFMQNIPVLRVHRWKPCRYCGPVRSHQVVKSILNRRCDSDVPATNNLWDQYGSSRAIRTTQLPLATAGYVFVRCGRSNVLIAEL